MTVRGLRVEERLLAILSRFLGLISSLIICGRIQRSSWLVTRLLGHGIVKEDSRAFQIMQKKHNLVELDKGEYRRKEAYCERKRIAEACRQRHCHKPDNTM